MNIRKHIDLLGLKVEDRVTGLRGIVACMSFNLYGCIQAAINPGLDKDKKMRDSLWLDVSRLKVLSSTPVMPPPNFEYGLQAEGRQGPAEKPSFSKP